MTDQAIRSILREAQNYSKIKLRIKQNELLTSDEEYLINNRQFCRKELLPLKDIIQRQIDHTNRRGLVNVTKQRTPSGNNYLNILKLKIQQEELLPLDEDGWKSMQFHSRAQSFGSTPSFHAKTPSSNSKGSQDIFSFQRENTRNRTRVRSNAMLKYRATSCKCTKKCLCGRRTLLIRDNDRLSRIVTKLDKLQLDTTQMKHTHGGKTRTVKKIYDECFRLASINI